MASPPLLAEDQYFDSGGVSIRYIEAGTGEPVILIHGFSGSADNWVERGVFNVLAQNYRVIALDSRGHGKSDKPHDPDAYGMNLARDILNLLDHLEIEKTHMMGYSQGALLTGVFLDRWPERLITATIAAGAPFLAWDDSTASFFGGASEWARKRAEDPEVNDGLDWHALALVPASFDELVLREERIAKANVPVLAVAGSEDRIRDGIPSSEWQLKFGKSIPDYKQVVVEGATHFGEKGLDRQPEFLEAIQAFLLKNSEAN